MLGYNNTDARARKEKEREKKRNYVTKNFFIWSRSAILIAKIVLLAPKF